MIEFLKIIGMCIGVIVVLIAMGALQSYLAGDEDWYEEFDDWL